MIAPTVFWLCLIAFLAGFVLLELIGIRQFVDRTVLLPMGICLGLAFLVILTMAFGLVYLDYIVAVVIFVSLAFLSIHFLRSILRAYIPNRNSIPLWPIALSFILLSISIWRFSYLADIWGWAPVYDSMTHGTWIGLIQYNNRIPLTTYPVGDIPISPIRYPMGFHLIGAFFSYLTGSYPGQTVVILGTLIVSLIPLVLFAITYLSTRSYRYALIAFVVAYFLPGGVAVQWSPSHDLLLGNFIVGTYPNLLGNLLLLAILMVEVCFDRPFFKSTSLKFPRAIILSLITAALALSYYPLVPFVVLYIVMCETVDLRGKMYRNLRIILLVGVLSGYAFLTFMRDVVMDFLYFDSEFYYSSYQTRYGIFMLDSNYLIYSILILVALPIAIRAIIKKQRYKMEIFYLALALPILISANRELYMTFLWFVQLDRLLIMSVAASYVVIIRGVSEISNGLANLIPRKFGVRRKNRQIRGYLSTISLGVVLILMAPSFVGHITYVYPPNLQESLPHGDDLNCMVWLVENVRNEELILNDILHISLWLTTLRPLNVVNSRQILLEVYRFYSQNNTLVGNRTRECNQILMNPWDFDLVRSMSDRYGLSYIYISSDRLNKILYARGRPVIPPLSTFNITQELRMNLYEENPNLEVVFRSGNSAIFRVT